MLYQLTFLCPKCGDPLSQGSDVSNEMIAQVRPGMRLDFVGDEVRATAMGLALIMDRHVASGCADKSLVCRTMNDG